MAFVAGEDAEAAGNHCLKEDVGILGVQGKGRCAEARDQVVKLAEFERAMSEGANITKEL